MISLCYVSSTTRNLSDSELLALLKGCQLRNAELEITGLLLYNGKGTYLQVLEGNDLNVQTLYAKIKNDPRHHRVTKLGERNIDSREFPQWKMGFKNTSKLPPQESSAFSHFMDDANAERYLTANSNFAYQMLHHFKNTSTSLLI